MVIMEFSMTPLGEGTSVSRFVARCVDLVDHSGLAYRLTPMGTIVEGEIGQLLALLQRCFDALTTDCQRVTCSVKFDYRQATESRLDSKVRSVERELGRNVRK